MEPNTEKTYEITLIGNDISVNKKVISEELAHKILVLLVPSNSTKLVEAYGNFGETSTIGELSPKAFMIQKRPTTDIERIACLAYYLSHQRGVAAFKTEDLTALNREAQQVNLSNPSATARNAVDIGYLSLAGGGRKQMTVTGEAIVEALPDREQVKKALELNQRRRPRRAKKTEKNQVTEEQ